MSSSLNVNTEAFYTMLESAQKPLYEGCNISKLETTARLSSIKSSHNMSQFCFNKMVCLMEDAYPSESHIQSNYHQHMRKVKELGMDVQKIDYCPNGCMLYYKHDENLDTCKFYGHGRRLP